MDCNNKKDCITHFIDEDLNAAAVKDSEKIFNDPIHGHIELHPLLVKIIDTPQFQRLRNIKQLGVSYFVYPGASHNRFEHCIGTCYLAGKLTRHLQEIHPEKIDDRDVLCVEIAGLCHDLGHGPFSHMFDVKFLPKANPNTSWTHEQGSCDMFSYLVEDNKLEDEFKKYNLKIPNDIIFIKEMINGPLDHDQNLSQSNQQVWPYRGRKQNKSFLYEIVSNDRNKVDVDKWDYFARDCYHLGIRNSFDHNRFMKFLKVLTVEGEFPQICARDKECINLYEMFHTRSVLHKRAYQHRVSTAIETMVCDALLLADKHIEFAGKNSKMLKISETVKDPVAYSKLSDHIFYQILYSTNSSDDMQAARAILQRILRRDLYKFVGLCRPPKGEEIEKSCVQMAKELARFDASISPSDIVVDIKKYSYGMNKNNPCDQFRFYSKQNPDIPYQIRREEVSHMLPDTFYDSEILVHCRAVEKKEAVLCCLVNWCSKNGFKSPNTFDSLDSTLTPIRETSKRPASEEESYISAKSMRF